MKKYRLKTYIKKLTSFIIYLVRLVFLFIKHLAKKCKNYVKETYKQIKKELKQLTNKDKFLLSIFSISYAHTFFRNMGVIDVFLFIKHERNVSFTVFMTGVYVKLIILSYCIWNPKDINRNVGFFVFIASVIDFIHWFTLSGIGFWQEKLILTFFVYYSVKKIRWEQFYRKL